MDPPNLTGKRSYFMRWQFRITMYDVNHTKMYNVLVKNEGPPQTHP